jgi:monothiol glutaredoxin
MTTPTPAGIRQISAQELEAMLNQRLPLELLDVRTEAERAIAKIQGARHLDEAAVAYLQGLDRDTLLVFHCHHGIRSQAAAQYFLAQGFTNICNLEGGIEAWSTTVDPSVRRY